MSNIKTSPNRPLTTCGSKRKVNWPSLLSPKPGSKFKPGSRNEASPAVSRRVTATAADHSHHSRLSILRKWCEGLSGCLMFLTGMLSAFVRLIDDHPFVPAPNSAVRFHARWPSLPLSARRKFLVRCPGDLRGDSVPYSL